MVTNRGVKAGKLGAHLPLLFLLLAFPPNDSPLVNCEPSQQQQQQQQEQLQQHRGQQANGLDQVRMLIIMGRRFEFGTFAARTVQSRPLTAGHKSWDS